MSQLNNKVTVSNEGAFAQMKETIFNEVFNESSPRKKKIYFQQVLDEIKSHDREVFLVAENQLAMAHKIILENASKHLKVCLREGLRKCGFNLKVQLSPFASRISSRWTNQAKARSSSTCRNVVTPICSLQSKWSTMARLISPLNNCRDSTEFFACCRLKWIVKRSLRLKRRQKQALQEWAM